MTATNTSALDLPRRAPAGGTDDRGSLLLRIAVFIGALLALLGLTLFAAVDYWISREIESVERDRIARHVAELRERLNADVRQVRGLASLAAGDSDLVHSTQYHVRLSGEAKAAEQDVKRIATTLDFASVALFSLNGRLIVRSAPPATVTGDSGLGGATGNAGDTSSSVVWDRRKLWIVGFAPVQSEGLMLAWLRVERLASVNLLLGDAPDLRLVPSSGGLSRTTIAVVGLDGGPTHLEMVSDDRSGAIIARAKRTLGAIFLFGGLVAAAVMLLLLRREMRPLRDLTKAVEAVGRGDFRQRVRSHGVGEIAALTNAFNGMTEDLVRLRGMEQSLREQEKITAVGRLATRLAHDINNPITVIKSAAMLLRGRLDSDMRTSNDLDLIVRHADRCANILRGLLRFGRPMRGKSEWVALGALCTDVITQVRVRRPSGQWILMPGEGDRTVRADRGELENMLENLLNNAYEAAPDSPIELRWGEAEDGIFLEVRDHGAGFSQEALDHLFELFFTTKVHGTGIGLANMYATARAHGAEVLVRNDGGAVVRIVFPAANRVSPG